MNYVDPKALLEHHGWVRALARTLVRNGAAADDLEQEAWVRALGPQPRPISNVKNWLAAIVRNTARDGWRKEGRVAHLNRYLAADCEPGHELGGERLPEETPEERQIRIETHKAMLTALTKLEDPYGTVVYLRFVDELSVEQIASKLGRPQATVRTQLRRGLDRVQESMQANLGEDWRARVVLLAMPSFKSTSTILATGGLTLMGFKSLLAAVVAVILALFVWDFDEPMNGAARDTSRAATEEVAAVLQSPDLETVSQRGPVEAEVESPITTPEPKQQTLAAAQRPGIKVIVRDPVTMAPLPNAEVLVFDRVSPSDEAFGKAMFEEWLGMEALLERFGESHKVDKFGVLWLPERKSHMHLAARYKGAFAKHYLTQAIIPGKQETVELFPTAQLHIKVRVVHADGAPASHQTVEYQQIPNTDWGQRLERVITDSDGLAVFRNMQNRLNDSTSSWPFRFAVAIPGLQQVSQVIDPKNPPQETIVLKLPPLATVVVQVLDAAGKPIAKRKSVTLHAQPAGDGNLSDMHEENMFATNSCLGGITVSTSNGKARALVIPGQTLMAWTTFGSSGALTKLTFQGPSYPGETLQVTLQAKKDLGRARLAIVDAAGRPTKPNRYSCSHVRLDGSFVGEEYGTSHASNDDGIIAVSAPAIVLPDGTTSENPMGATFLSAKQEGSVRFGWTEWTLGQETELVLGPQLLASGQVLYRSGEPVPECSVWMTLRLPWTKPTEEPSRSNQAYLSFKADAEGKFAVYGPLPPAGHTYELEVGQPISEGSFRAIPVPFEPGQVDLLVTLQDLPWIEGHIQLDQGHAALLRVAIKQVEGGGSFPRDLDAQGRFKLRPDFEGQAKLILTSGGAAIAESPLFEVKNGVDTCPEGWSALDLRGQLTLHTVQVEAASGTLPKWVTVMLVDHGMGSSFAPPAHFVTREKSVLIYVSADGFQTSEPQTISGSAQITLVPK